MVLNATFNNISVIPWWWKIKGITPEPKNMIKFKIQLDLPSMLPDLEYKFKIIFVMEIQVNEYKPIWDGGVRIWVKINVPDTGS
jgi:hypothetical protein